MKTLIMIIFVFSAAIVSAQDECKLVKDEKSGKQMLIGVSTREAFKDTSFSWWFDSEYENYTIKKKELGEDLPSKLKDYQITIVMGTWCSDSRREVPRFFKILDELNYPSDSIRVINVDRDMKDIDGEVTGLSVKLVPTIIFYKEDKEEGRIIEVPVETLEKDITAIVHGTYKNEEDKE